MKVTITNIIKEIRINHVLVTDIDNLIKERAISEKPAYWCHGNLFFYYEDESDKIAEQIINGIYIIDFFCYAKCEKRIEKSKWDGHSIEVINYTGHSTFEKLFDSLEDKQ